MHCTSMLFAVCCALPAAAPTTTVLLAFYCPLVLLNINPNRSGVCPLPIESLFRPTKPSLRDEPVPKAHILYGV